MARNWQRISSAPNGRPVLTKIDDARGVRNEQVLTRRGNLWWVDKNGEPEMYVYYAPTHWAEVE